MRLIPHLLLVFLLAAIAESSPVAKKGKAKHPHKRKGKIAATSFLACDPPLLENPVCGSPFSIALKEKPAGKVVLYLEAPNIIFSKCRLDFTPNNWNVKQTINISPVPYITAVKRKRVVKLRLCGAASHNDPGLHKACQHYIVHRNGGAGATCNISGDPHYNSLGRRAFGFQGLGVFYVVKSDALTIQAGLEKWLGTSASVQRRIAIRYHDTVISYNGYTGKMRCASKAKHGIRMVKNGKFWSIRLSDGSYIRIGYHGSNPHFSLSLSITLGQAYKEKIGGLCGSFGTKAFTKPDGSAAKNAKGFGKSWRVEKGDNLFILGGKASSVKVFADACGHAMRKCKIPKLKPLPKPEPKPEPNPEPKPEPDNKVLPTHNPKHPKPEPNHKPLPGKKQKKPKDKGKKKKPVAGKKKKPTPGKKKKHPKHPKKERDDDDEPVGEHKDNDDYGDGGEKLDKGEEEVPVEKAEEVDLVKEEKEINIIIEATPTPPKVVKESWIKLARENCIKILTIKDANDILNPKIYVEECVDDLKLTGSFTFLEIARRSYLSAVMRLVTSTKYEPVVNRGVSKITIDLNIVIQKIETEFGFGKNKCPKDCSGRGECTESGCACLGGYIGADCSESVPKEIAVTEIFTEKESTEEDLDIEDAPEAKILIQVEEIEKAEPEIEKEDEEEGEEGEEEGEEAEGEGEEEETEEEAKEEGEAKGEPKKAAEEAKKEPKKEDDKKKEEKKEN